MSAAVTRTVRKLEASKVDGGGQLGEGRGLWSGEGENAKVKRKKTS